MTAKEGCWSASFQASTPSRGVSSAEPSRRPRSFLTHRTPADGWKGSRTMVPSAPSLLDALAGGTSAHPGSCLYQSQADALTALATGRLPPRATSHLRILKEFAQTRSRGNVFITEQNLTQILTPPPKNKTEKTERTKEFCCILKALLMVESCLI